jgi:DNA (cytosine-5)-methyltransferase 1
MDCVAVDLFCGIGGLTHGIQNMGIRVVAGIDLDSSCRYAYEQNNESIFINAGVESLSSSEIEKLYPENSIRVLMGCAPCQPFSNYSLRYVKYGHKDDKWKLLYYFIDHVEKIRPHIVSMENVPQLSSEQVFVDFVSKLKSFGYHVNWSIVNCADYGVPQTRNRLVLLASLLAPIQMIDPLCSKDNYVTVRDTISKLPALADGDVSEKDRLHKSSKLSGTNKKRIRQSVPGGTWQDWEDALKLPCHVKHTGQGYRAVYGRMEWDKPSPTITTQFYGYGNGRFGHPVQDRAISLREGALLQSFPANYDFIDDDFPQTMKKIGVHIGNAVPVKLGEAIGKSILQHLTTKGVSQCQTS